MPKSRSEEKEFKNRSSQLCLLTPVHLKAGGVGKLVFVFNLGSVADFYAIFFSFPWVIYIQIG